MMKKRLIYFFITILILLTNISYSQKTYLSTWESLSSRAVPAWFGKAKLGIFIHWGLYSVPAWAPSFATPDKVKDWYAFYKNNPYAEWYLNTLKISGSPTQLHHGKIYGAGYNYYSFADSLSEQTKKWNADSWADIFYKIGARYVVFTTKHHDGYVMYPSTVPNPFFAKELITSKRDFAGEVARAVRKKGLKFGVYYSGGLDWTFYRSPITNLWPDLFESMPKSIAYTAYADAQYYELIHRYSPDILWNDVNYPGNGDVAGIFAECFNANPDAVVNDRWRRSDKAMYYSTPEYVVLDSITENKWESCRGIGHSFGYNQAEKKEHLITSDQLINMLVDIVSKNGNLLINVGPKADGSIPENQLKPLLDLGKWLQINGEGIYDTKPWIKPSLMLEDKTELRFTKKDSSLYIYFFSVPKNRTVIIPDCQITGKAKAILLGDHTTIGVTPVRNGVQFTLPKNLAFERTFMIKISEVIN